MLRSIIKKTPVVREIALWAMRQTSDQRRRSINSSDYWEARYQKDGNSGPGSYGHLAEFKAEYLNTFVKDYNIKSVLELGCGDGAQLALAEYPQYLGVDVSPTIVEQAMRRHKDTTKSFITLEEYEGVKVDLALSLDVIYHLLEDDVFEAHMRQLFEAGRFVVIYASNDERKATSPHVRHRRFTDWIKANTTARQVDFTPNRYPFDEADMDNTSFADFYAYQCY